MAHTPAMGDSPRRGTTRALTGEGLNLAALPPRMIAAGPVELAAWQIGAGPDLVLLHGWPLHAATFRRLVPTLARSFTCHLLDLPGAGQARGEPGAAGGLPGYAQAVRAAIDALGLQRYGLVAHDSGAAVGRIVAASDRRAQALVLAGTEIPGYHPWQLRLLAAVSAMPGGERLLRRALASPAFRRSSLGFGGCFADPSYVDGEFSALFIEPLLRSPRAFAGHMALLGNLKWADVDALREAHSRISVPVRLIWGERDRFFPLARARALPAQFAGETDLHVIPGAGTYCHEDFPQEFLALAEPFLQARLR